MEICIDHETYEKCCTCKLNTNITEFDRRVFSEDRVSDALKVKQKKKKQCKRNTTEKKIEIDLD